MSTFGPADLARLLDSRPKRTGRGFKVRCPAHHDPAPSLHISPRSSGRGVLLHCFAGCAYRDVVAAIRLQHGVDLRTQAVEAPPAPPARPAPPLARWAGPIPARRHPLHHPEYGPPSHVWTYRDRDGNAIAYAARYPVPDPYLPQDHPAIRKTFLPWSYWRTRPHASARFGPPALRPRMPPSPRPLYNLPQLVRHPEDPVILVFGEKTADAAGRLFPDHLASTWLGGDRAFAQTDFTPLENRPRPVVILPDNDAACARMLPPLALHLDRHDIAHTVIPLALQYPLLLAEPPARPRWDVADLVDAGVTLADTSAWRATLPPRHPLHLKPFCRPRI